jgi:hypothetical protein
VLGDHQQAQKQEEEGGDGFLPGVVHAEVRDDGADHEQRHERGGDQDQIGVPDAGDEQRGEGDLGGTDGGADEVGEVILVELVDYVGKVVDPDEGDRESDDDLCRDGERVHGWVALSGAVTWVTGGPSCRAIPVMRYDSPAALWTPPIRTVPRMHGPPTQRGAAGRDKMDI